jgi:hypothetical protein
MRVPTARRLAIIVILGMTVLATTMVGARASWQAGATGAGSTRAAVVSGGAVPSAALAGSSVNVSWSAVTVNDAIVRYQVRRYDAATGVAQSMGAGCAGTLSGTSCAESAVPAGSWRYSVTPVVATWSGAESARSAAVAVPFVNPGFESGLTGWVDSPAPSQNQPTMTTGSFAGYAPHAGGAFAVLAPGAADTYAHLSQTFNAAAGDTINGWAFFKTDDYMPYNDDGALVIRQGGTDLATVFAGSVSTVGDHGGSAWTLWSYTFPAAGTYTVDARVRNQADDGTSSYIGLDDITIVPAP